MKNHRVLVSGDSLPMHFALGLSVRCVTIFNCTSPWEICDYGVQRKITSPLFSRFFFKRGLDERAITAIPLDGVSPPFWNNCDERGAFRKSACSPPAGTGTTRSAWHRR